MSAEERHGNRMRLRTTFADEWCCWWGSIQPSFRAVEGLCIYDELAHPAVTAKEDWECLCVGGLTGFCLVIYSLALCGPWGPGPVMPQREWIQWAYDVLWVLNKILYGYV